jgi:peptide-methionine (S)-S-oxide reductase
MQTAVFAGGCFWCTEAIFQSLKGVVSVLPGYTGGSIKSPTYEMVCGGDTGHAEATKVEFNPEVITYEVLLEVFFATHDPTTLNRQGHDVGTQYRSAIFYSSEEQKKMAETYINSVQKDFSGPIVTQLEPLGEFYVAENYHQDYFNNNKNAPYCQVVINPKLKKFREKFANLIVS